ncbi:MAG TPA: hypothetical protein VNC22_23290 [Sporichthya sp.]|nr:hypothetical protein [Sporichthya sp.]
MPARTPSKRVAAKTLAAQIVRASHDLYEALVAFAKIKGWRELGYTSFGAWADDNMPVTRWVAYQELHRAQVLDKIAAALHLPISEVSHAAASLPQGEASAVAGALDADDEIIEAIVVEEEDPVAVMEKVRAAVGRAITDEPNRPLRAWAERCRKLAYPDSLDAPTREALIEAQTFIEDCLASWED